MRIIWLVPDLDITNPAHRVRRYNMHHHLRRMGYDSVLDNSYRKDFSLNIESLASYLNSYDVVVWTDLGELEDKCARALRSSKVTQVFDHCESLWDLPHERSIMESVDLITCCSVQLANLTIGYGFPTKVAVIRDAVEQYPESLLKKHTNSREGLRAVYMGGRGHDAVCEWARPVIEDSGYDLVIISGGNPRSLDWSLETWKDDMLSCDVALALQDYNQHPAKSNIKATVPMALGIPVLASPLDAYKESIENGVNGLICIGIDGWKSALETMKDPYTRSSMGLKASLKVSRYSLDYISSELLDAIRYHKKEI